MGSKAKPKPEPQPTSIRIDPAVYKRAQHYKIDSGRKITDIVTTALDEYLRRHGA